MITAGECTATEGLLVVGTTLTRRPLSGRVNTGSPATNIRGWTLTEIPEGFRPPTSRPTPLMQETRDAPTRTKFAQSLTEARSVGGADIGQHQHQRNRSVRCRRYVGQSEQIPGVCYTTQCVSSLGILLHCMTTVEHLVRQDAQMDRPNTPHHMYHQGSKPLTRKR